MKAMCLPAMRQIQLNAFKWKPFDLYNDIYVERDRKMSAPLLKPASSVKDNRCDDFARGSGRRCVHLSPSGDIKTDKASRDSALLCEQCKSIYKLDDVAATDKIDGDDNCGVNWNACASSASPSPRAASVSNVSDGASHKHRQFASKNDVIELERDVENTSPISVYGPLPYSK